MPKALGWETPGPAKNVVTETQDKFMSWKLQNLASGTGWVKLGLLIFAGLVVANAGRAQTSFSSPQVLSGDYGSVTNDNSSVKPPGPQAPNIAGFAPNGPFGISGRAPSDGEVELDTIGSMDDTNGTPPGHGACGFYRHQSDHAQSGGGQ